jgi:sodium transport system permease protein
MRLHYVLTVFRKEMLDMLRDRRTMISMVAMPVLVIPVILFFMGKLVGRAEERSQQEARRLGIAAQVSNPQIRAALEGLDLPLRTGIDPREAIEKKEAAAGVVESALPDGRPRVELLTDRSNPTSAVTGEKIRTALTKLRESQVREGLKSANVPVTVLEPFALQQTNVASAKKMAGNLWGSMLGYMLLLLMFTGGMYPVIDMTAGEKERKTIEAFLASPVHRLEIVIGKILTATVAILVTAALTLASVTFSIRSENFSRTPEMKAMMQTIPLDGQNLALIALTLLPLAILAASMMIAIALFARSFKEGQSYLTPLAFIVIFPALMGGLPGMELSLLTALVPILNASQLIRGILLGEWTVPVFAMTLAANVVYAAIATVVATRTFNKESVLFRS